jgi:hypothetical protein
MKQDQACPWCGGPLTKGSHHCHDCHRKQLLAMGICADVYEEDREKKEIEERQKWLSEKESGGYLTIDEVCTQINRSKRWVWYVLRGNRTDLCWGVLGKLFGFPEGTAIINSRYGVLISKNLIPFFISFTRKPHVYALGNEKYVSSQLASEEFKYSRRWINQLVKSGKLPGHYEFRRAWVDWHKLQEYQGEQPSPSDDLVIRQGI